MPLDKNVVWNKMWQFSPPTRFGEKYKDTIVNAKNIHLYTYANVVNIKANANISSVEEVTVKNYAGKEHRVRAKYFVLACCSIQNARVLLASNQQAPKGLGNDNDLVGRFFMEHIEIKAAELWLAKPDPMQLYMWEWGKTKARAELAISAQKQQEYKILNGTAALNPLEIAKGEPSMIEIWSEDAKKNMERLNSYGKEEGDNGETKVSAEKKAYQSFQLFTRVEQAPNPNSRVTLDTEKDSLGMPRAILHWELTPFEKRSIRQIYTLIGEEVGRTGIGRVRLMEYLRDEKDESWPEFTGGGWHHMGTTRMSEDPKQGVVDANCKVHGISNLFVAGASCYVTAAAPNPTLTLIALTIRLADHLKDVIKNPVA